MEAVSRFCSLQSGSNGNALYFENGKTKLLIDCGISAKRVAERLAELGVAAAELDGILVTHEHSDHVAGIRVFAKRFGTPVYATAGTLAAVEEQRGSVETEMHVLRAGQPFDIGSVTVQPFDLPHDAREPVGYILHTGERKIAIATDMGKICETIALEMKSSDFVFLESNYDEMMLKTGRYHPQLKRRILSSEGHFSNDQAAKFAAALVRSGTGNIMLGHLSANNNRPPLAYGRVSEEIRRQGAEIGADVLLEVASRSGAGKIVDI